MEQKNIVVKGARENNLKNIDITIPRSKFVVVTGLSGSGKSSLAFDTIYAEGQRRYVESLSAYARQFLGNMEKPNVDAIEGLSPAISVDQKTTSKNPRSTVGTITEIYDYLRLLYARIGIPYCPTHNVPIESQSIEQMVDKIYNYKEDSRISILAPVIVGQKGTHEKAILYYQKEGYIKARINGELYDLDDNIKLDKNKKHTIEIVVSRVKLKPDNRSRIYESVEASTKLAEGKCIVIIDDNEMLFSENFACNECDFTIPALEPRLFSFNSPFGACPTCKGLGIHREFTPEKIMPDLNLSIDKGGIKGVEKGDTYFYTRIKTLCEHFEIDMTTPVGMLSKEKIDILMYGTEEVMNVKYVNKNADREYNFESTFEGFLAMYQRRYKETSSNYMREYYESLMTEAVCPTCSGRRLSQAALSVKINGINIEEYTRLSIKDALKFVNELELTEKETIIAELILKEIKERLSFLINVGLDYLNLNRKSGTLSGGEAQRIRLATQIGSRLTGVLYVLDEPSIGLHQRDNTKLINTLKEMRDLGNTLIVVEHDEETMIESDYLIDIGPGAGVHGGNVVSLGTPQEVMNDENSVTGKYLSGKLKIDVPTTRRKHNGNFIRIFNAQENNLKGIDVELPMGVLNIITGVSGSGKSSLIHQILCKAARKSIYRSNLIPGKHDKIEGLEHLDRLIEIDQSPIGRTPRSNPATYTGLFDHIRDLFTATPEAKARGYKKGRFSFNVKGGRCETCRGDGVIKIEMHFLPDVYVECEECKGKRYNRETLEVKYKGKTISDVLNMTIEEALEFFNNIPKIKSKLETLNNVGLGYIRLGQRATTLSGGEAQRVKLASELYKRITSKSLYILDEPTTGLHMEDVRKLLIVINDIVNKGATVLIIEHNLDIVKQADHIIDIGPEGGDEGGMVVATGTPEEVVKVKGSYTGQYLKPLLNK